MALQVVGAGFGRTGTLSLKSALETLGFGPCYHMVEVGANDGHVGLWSRVADGGFEDWEGLFGDYHSVVDWPACRYWRELAAAFPDSKVVLSLRNPTSWGTLTTPLKKPWLFLLPFWSLLFSEASISPDIYRALLNN